VSADDVLPPKTARDVELRHGYTLDHVRSLSIWTVRHDPYHAFADFDERLEVAWHAIIEHLYTCDQPPIPPEVIKAAWRAIGHHLSKDQHFRRGYSNREPGRDATASTGFMRYWLDSGQPASGPEERATEYLALAQIWARLRPKDRELLAAMAEHEDYAKAAAALGKPRHTYATEIGLARKAFRELWHEGETPSRPWGADRRASKPDSPKMRVTYRLVRRRAAQARAHARQGGKQQRATDPATKHQEHQ
jgi:hypothetical protein